MFEPRFVVHRGKEIFRLDFVAPREPELIAALDKANGAIHAAPLNSLRILANYTSPLTPRGLGAEAACTCRPHIRATAVIGSSFWKIVFTDLQVHGREDVGIFDDEASALDWLARA